MRKKLIVKQNMSLLEEVQRYEFEAVKSSFEIEKLKKIIEDKDEEIASLKRRLNENNNPGEVQANEQEQPPLQTVEEQAGQDTSSDESRLRFDESVVLDDSTELGAAAIGELVVASAEYSNRLSQNPENTNRELLNLILGRTEVAKSEILNVVSGDYVIEEKQSLVNDIKVRAFEYFDSVMAQL